MQTALLLQMLFRSIDCHSLPSTIQYNNSYLDALFDIYQSYEFLTNHTTIRDRIKITELQNNVIKRLVDECTQVLSSLLKSEKVSNIIDFL